MPLIFRQHSLQIQPNTAAITRLELNMVNRVVVAAARRGRKMRVGLHIYQTMVDDVIIMFSYHNHRTRRHCGLSVCRLAAKQQKP